MKYIDADRFRMELEKRLKNVRDYMNGAGMKYKGPKYFRAQGRESAYDALLNTIDSLQQEQDILVINKKDWEAQEKFLKNKKFGVPLQQEQLEIDLNGFTQKMDDWKARYNHPDNIPIKATMAFTARMFYMYPNVARQWYDSLPKATMD